MFYNITYYTCLTLFFRVMNTAVQCRHKSINPIIAKTLITHVYLRLSHFCRNFPQWMKPYNHSEYMCMPCMPVFIIKNRRPDLKKSILIAFGSLIGHIVNRNGLTSSKAFFCKISKGK